MKGKIIIHIPKRIVKPISIAGNVKPNNFYPQAYISSVPSRKEPN
jgi:hypothetical protein